MPALTGELYELGANLTLMIQADMLGYHAPGEPAQLGLPARCVLIRRHCLTAAETRHSIGSQEVMQLVSNLSAIYSPELVIGTTSVSRGRRMQLYIGTDGHFIPRLAAATTRFVPY